MADQTKIIGGWERSLIAADKVKERLYRATRALEAAGIAYAVVGGNAVAEWVARIDEEAVRNTRDVDILIRRGDFHLARTALESVGFVYCHLLDVDMFLDGPDGKPSGAVHLLFASEKMRPEHSHTAPRVEDSERGAHFQVTTLHELVQMKLLSWCRKDQTHLVDLIHVGLIDNTWPGRFSTALAERLQELLDDPNE